jgi:small subunit ribosomal protein S17
MGRPRNKDEEAQGHVADGPPQEPEAEAEAGTPTEDAPAAAAEPPAEESATEVVTEDVETSATVGEAARTPEAPAEQPKTKRRIPRAERRQRPKPSRAESGKRKPIVRLPRPEHPRGRRKERRGVVVSSAMDKTIVVRVDTVKPHPVYKKIVRRSRRFHAHDEGNVAKPGDVVRIVETRPVSKTKTWRLAEVLEEAR